MTFDALLTQMLDLLQHQWRVAYSALKVRLNLDDDCLPSPDKPPSTQLWHYRGGQPRDDRGGGSLSCRHDTKQ